MKFKIPRIVMILGQKFDVIKEPDNGGGNFSLGDAEIKIGTKHFKKSPDYTFQILVHEISEVIHCIIATRYDDYSASNNYKFFMDHKEFENHNTILSGIIFNQLI